MVDDALEEKLLGLFDLIDVLQEVEGLTRVLKIVVEIQFDPIKVSKEHKKTVPNNSVPWNLNEIVQSLIFKYFFESSL